jgi:hypothetical protein
MKQRLRTIVLLSGVLALTVLLMAPPADAFEGSPLDCPSAVLVDNHAGARALARSSRSALSEEPLPATTPLRAASVPDSLSPAHPALVLNQLCVLRC